MKNPSVSVRQRLATLARVQREEFQELLSRYARERLLYRPSVSSWYSRADASSTPTRERFKRSALGHATTPARLEVLERLLCPYGDIPKPALRIPNIRAVILRDYDFVRLLRVVAVLLLFKNLAAY